jgi:hypothetical protein
MKGRSPLANGPFCFFGVFGVAHGFAGGWLSGGVPGGGHRGLSVVLKEGFDGLIYVLLTAGTFGWLWPR